MRASPCTWRHCTGKTATILRRAASRAWRALCVAPWPWIPGKRVAFPPPRARCKDVAMKIYTLHLPRDARPGDPEILEQAELVKDGFSWGAFLFTFLWLLFHRLWLAGIAVLVALIAFDVALALLQVQPFAATVAHLLLMLLIGFEAN